LQPTNTHDVVSNSSLAYQAGPLGGFYQPAGGLLIDAGNNQLPACWACIITRRRPIR